MINDSRPQLLHDLLELAARRAPEAIAVRDEEGAWSYAELLAQSRACARWLHRRGTRPGDRVLIAAVPDRRVVAVLFACSLLAAVCVPVSGTAKRRQWTHYVADCGAAVILTADALNSSQAEWDDDDELPAAALPHDTALLIYTSGSTAVPKAVVCPHASVLFATLAIAERLGYRASDVVFCRVPLSFDYGLYQVFLCAHAGAELVLAAPDSDAGLLASIRRCGATVVPVVPHLAEMLLRLGARDGLPTSIRLLTNTGETLPPATVSALRQRFSGAKVQLMYGITECKRVSIMEADGDLDRPGALGRPLSGTRVRVLDTSGADVAPGELGELVVSGPHVMAGYWGDPGLGVEVFGTDPESGERALRTGDFGRLDEDGYLYFHGRRDQIFKRRGIRMSTLEIEAAAREVPGVAEAALVPPDEGRDAVLLVVASISAAKVLRELGERLDSARVPELCRVVDHLPRNSSGKLDRAMLARLEAAG
ncbi:class I adenylate-forming enzyme family protein [Sphaerisporangium fuscum]|uniref:class I adenylate-forming enzyme family protein n=1 Tax=Sphaerisporangium fuscum TaxID=2835868 RepID=UPI001BDC7035|nr:AMP-binding protein [Sphaerisporangium fuscum]